MVQAGQVFDDGTTRLEFTVTGSESDGTVHEMRVTYGPHSPFPPPHLHPQQDERFEVLRGELLFIVDGEETLVPEGRSIDIPRRSVHQVRNVGETPAVAIWQTFPALRTGEFHEAIAAARRQRDAVRLLAVVEEFSDVFELAEQPTA